MALVLTGGLAAVAAGWGGASPEWAMVPLSAGLLAAALVMPFPAADYYLAALIGMALPALPPSDLPNAPVGMAAIAVAVLRILPGQSVPRRAAVVLAAFWAPLALGVAVSDWPEPRFWMRPAAVVAVGVLASVLGFLVAADRARLVRWIIGFSVFAGIVSVTALAVYAAQFVVRIQALVTWLATVQGYARGEAAAEFFELTNNWVIWSPAGGVMRAVSPFIPAPHGVGAILGLTVPLLASLVLMNHPATRPRVALWWAVLGLGTAVLVLTLSRATWLAAGISALAGAAIVATRLRDRSTLRRAAKMAAGAVLTVSLASVTVLATGQSASGVGTRITEASEDESVTDRVESGRSALEAIGRNPLRGYGLGGWSVAEPHRIGASYVHNVYLEYTRALGVSGLTWAIAIPFVLVAAGLALIRRTDADRFIGLGLAAAGTFAAVHFLFDDSFLVPQYAWLLFVVVGAALRLSVAPPPGQIATRAGA